MIWSIDWRPAARRDLLWMSWQTAARIDAAVMRFAETGRGGERILPSSTRLLRVRAVGGDAHVWLDPKERTVHVLRAFARR